MNKEQQKKEKVYLAYITCPDKKYAHDLALKCLKKKWAVCANIFPEIDSLYEWNHELQKDTESVLILKTKESCLSDLKKHIPMIHKYDCPCLLFIEIKDGYQKFIDWIRNPSSTS